MTEQRATSKSYCDVCGIDVEQDSNLKRFGKFFCSKEHMEAYVRTRQMELGLEGHGHPRRERRWFGGC